MFEQTTDQAILMNTRCVKAHQCLKEGALGTHFWSNFKDRDKKYEQAISFGLSEVVSILLYHGYEKQLVEYYSDSKTDTIPKELLLDWFLEKEYTNLLFDDFTFKSVMKEEEGYKELEDHDFDSIHTHFKKCFPWVKYNESASFKKIISFSQKNKVDTKRDYFNSLPKTKRKQKEIIAEVCEYLSVPPEEKFIAKMYLSLWFTGLVHRSLNPGAKFDLVLVLNGAQGVGKTTFLERIFPKDTYVMSNSRDLDSKDKLINLSTNSIVIWDEIGSFSSKYMTETIKQFLTLCVDTFRPVYGRQTVSRGRRCIFAATTNDPDILDDLSGSRRFMVITVGRSGEIDNKKISKLMPELLSASLQEYQAGELKPYFSQEQTVFQMKNNETYAKEEPLLDIISRWVSCPLKEEEIRRDRFTTLGVCLEALAMPAPTVTRSTMSHVGKVLRSIGYKNKKVREGKDIKTIWIYQGKEKEKV